MNEAHNEFVDYKKATALFATMGWQMPDHQPQIVLRPSLDADFRFEKQRLASNLRICSFIFRKTKAFGLNPSNFQKSFRRSI